jgi:MFS family permease
LQAFNHGLWIAAVLAVKDYFKEYLGLDPGEMATYVSIIHIPWSFKILYGLISDNVPIMGTRRKSYLVLMGAVDFLALFSLYAFQFDEPLTVAIVLAIASASEAFVNVVSDAIMVIQSRKDKAYGSQDFVTLMYLATGFGGVLGCIFAGLCTQYSHPKWIFFSYSFFGILVSVFACRLTPESERDKVVDDGESYASTSQEDYEFRVRERILNGEDIASINERPIPKRDGFCFNLKKNCQAIGRALTMREIYFLVIFFIA